MNKMRGFTMLEIIITLVVISILTVIAVPGFKKVMIQEQLNLSATDLISVLQKAQSRALLEKEVIQVYIGSGPNLTDTELSWLPSGKAYIKDGAVEVFVGKQGFMQTSLTDVTYAGVKSFIICSETGSHSRKISFNRIGIITDSGLRENCNED